MVDFDDIFLDLVEHAHLGIMHDLLCVSFLSFQSFLKFFRRYPAIIISIKFLQHNTTVNTISKLSIIYVYAHVAYNYITEDSIHQFTKFSCM